jgi:hypothetical protein
MIPFGRRIFLLRTLATSHFCQWMMLELEGTVR